MNSDELKKRESRAFWAGVLFVISLSSLFQDWMGREGYSAWVLDHWTDARWTVPLALATLVTALYLLGKNQMERPR